MKRFWKYYKVSFTVFNISILNPQFPKINRENNVQRNFKFYKFTVNGIRREWFKSSLRILLCRRSTVAPIAFSHLGRFLVEHWSQHLLAFPRSFFHLPKAEFTSPNYLFLFQVAALSAHTHAVFNSTIPFLWSITAL